MSAEHPLDRLRPGMRAVVRYRSRTGTADALGRIEALDAEAVELETRRGRQVIPRSDVLLAKEVPPPPSRRGAPHRAISEEDLERAMVDGWPPLEREALGGWLLRASRGFTRRANSVLPLGDPGTPLGAAVERAEQWYAERELPALFALFGQPELEEELRERGYRERVSTLAMTASVGTVVGAAHDVAERHRRSAGSAGLTIAVTREPSEDWLATAAGTRPTDPEVLRHLVTGSPEQVFGEVRDGAETVLAIGRAPFAHVWAGLTNVHVEPSARRRGLATLVTAALAQEARARGIRSIWLQVEEGNAPARAAYERLGFGTHHRYRYLTR